VTTTNAVSTPRTTGPTGIADPGPGTAVRLALIGTRGFGAVHLRQMQPLRESGRVQLVGVVDVVEPEATVGAPWFTSLEDLLEGLGEEDRPEVVIIATPIGTHAPLAEQALRAGCHVYLEKPPVPSLTDLGHLLEVARETDRLVQVGFQARGGGGVARMRELLASGTLGSVRSVDAYGAWTRDKAYYQRSPWAGKRMIDGKRVADGVATNPLAHSIDVSLVIAGMTEASQVGSVTTELRHAHAIEADDTTYLRIDPADVDGQDGTRLFVQAALTTTSPEQHDPWVRLAGNEGTATLYYTADRLVLERPGADPVTETFERTSLLEDLLDHLPSADATADGDAARSAGGADDAGGPDDGSGTLISPLASTGAFMTMLEATQDRPDPAPIDPAHVTWVGEDLAAHPVVEDVEAWMSRAVDAGRPFSEIGAPWADPSAVDVYRA
jgi:predicted dehydrogenase